MSDLSDFLAERILPDGRLAAVMPLLGGRGRLGVGPADQLWFESEW